MKPAAITHQDIVDRREALSHELSEAWLAEQARIRKERESLHELCGGLGHVFGASPFGMKEERRYCVFCHAPEADRG